MKFVSKEEAVSIDNELLNEYKFTLEQLMELCGLGVAQAIAEAFPKHDKMKSCLIAVGPGINGAKGLVCARHIKHFGYSPVIFLITEVLRPLFINLQNQCELLDIPCLQELPEPEIIADNYEFVVDAIYGYNFEPPLRPGSVIIFNKLMSSKLPVCCIDIPSGWNADEGSVKKGLEPDVIISVIVPKQCISNIKGIQHFLTGRILPPILEEKYELNLPQFPGHSLYVKLD